MSKIYQLATVLALGLLLGYWFGRNHGSPNVGVEKSSFPKAARADGGAAQAEVGAARTRFKGTARELLASVAGNEDGMEARFLLRRGVDDLADDQLPAFAAELMDISDPHSNQFSALQDVLQRWLHIDKRAAMAWMQGLSKEKSDKAMYYFIVALAKISPDEALKFANVLPAASRDYAMQPILQALATTDPATAFAMLKKKGDMQGFGTLSDILAKWAKVDPQAALAALSQLPSDLRRNATFSIFGSWAGADPSSALHAATDLKSPEIRKAATDSCLTQWAEKDVAAAWAWYQALSPAAMAQIDAGALIRKLSTKDPASAIAALPSLPSTQRAKAIRIIASTWGPHDADAAWSWAQSLSGTDRTAAMTSVSGNGLADIGASKILAMAGEISSQKTKFQFIQGCFRQSDPNVVAEVVRTLPPEEARELFAHDFNILPSMMNHDLAGTLRLMQETKVPADQGAWRVAAERFSQQDPEAAFRWANELPVEYQKNALSLILGEMATTDGPAALQKAQSLTDQDTRNQALTTVFAKWSDSDPAAIEQSLPQFTGEMRAPALKLILSTKITDDPPSAGVYLVGLTRSENPVDVKIASDHFANLAHRWAENSPQAAASWASQVPAGMLQDRFIQCVADKWSANDAMEASIWIKALPGGPAKDGAVNNLIKNITATDPESALVWAGQIQNETKREAGYSAALKALPKKDPAAGQRAVQEAPINEALKTSLWKNP